MLLHVLPASLLAQIPAGQPNNGHDQPASVHSGAMGSPQQPTTAQLDQLHSAGQLQSLTSPAWLPVENGRITLPVSLPSQATSLLRLTWQ